MNNGNLVLSRKNIKNYLFIAAYVVMIYMLMIKVYGETFRDSYYGLLFVHSFNARKLILAIAETAVMLSLTVRKISSDRLSERTVFLISLLYFIPGTVQQAVTNADIKYMLFFFLFWVGMEVWLAIMQPQNRRFIPKHVAFIDIETYLLVLTVFAFLAIELIAFRYGRVFSVSGIRETLSDVYGVRAAYKEEAMHWTLVCIEYFAVYFLMLMITYYAERRRWIIVGLCCLAEMTAFLVQANRIIPFLAGIALVIGLFKVDKKLICFAFAVLAVVLVLEVLINSHGLIMTNIFRRYSIVPNRLSEQYFDYFTTHTPDFLRSKYTRFFSLIGMQSEYISPSVGTVIGHAYYHTDVNCNNGLVGGGVFMFGYAAPIVTTFGYVMAYRIFEAASSGLRNTKAVTCLAFVLATLSINTGTFLANIFSISYIMLLCVVLAFTGHSSQDALVEGGDGY